MPVKTEQTHLSQLYLRLSILRWLALLFGLFMALLHQFMEGSIRTGELPRWEMIELVYTVAISLVAWAVLTWLRRSVAQTATAERALNDTLTELSRANQRLESSLRVKRRLSEADDDAALANIITDLSLSETPAVACSLVRFDAQQRTLPVIYRRAGAQEEIDSQPADFSETKVREQCEACMQHSPEGVNTCTLVVPPLPASTMQKIYCLQLARDDQVYGILSLYLPDTTYPTAQEQLQLEMMVDEMTLAMQSRSLRMREMIMFNRLENARRGSNLQDELSGVLVDTAGALEATGGLLFLAKETSSELQLGAEAGETLVDALDLVKGLAKGAGHAETPLIISDLEQDAGGEMRSLLIAPLRVADQELGSLVLWSTRPDAFTRRQAQLVATVAGQAALLIENHSLYLHGEHRVALAERARLAREIHDGLAQTLGYLKLRTAQINNLLDRGQDQQARIALAEVQQLLGDAYLDTREAIDGLRLAAEATDLQAWVQEIILEFESLSGVQVTISSIPDVHLSPEIHVQLQRIIQESFSNIRKHADATRAWLEWQMDDYWLTLYIRDNGNGFDLNDIPPGERHGLRIMRERADLLDADFQVASQEDKGTEIIVRLPLKEQIGEAQRERAD